MNGRTVYLSRFVEKPGVPELRAAQNHDLLVRAGDEHRHGEDEHQSQLPAQHEGEDGAEGDRDEGGDDVPRSVSGGLRSEAVMRSTRQADVNTRECSSPESVLLGPILHSPLALLVTFLS